MRLPALAALAFLLLAGCGAPATDPPEDGAATLTPLPEAIHDERSVLASAGATNLCNPAMDCADHPFTLPRVAILEARVAWSSPDNSVAVEIRQDDQQVSFHSGAQGAETLVRMRLQPGDYVLRVLAYLMVDDRYVLDAAFLEVPAYEAPPPRDAADAAATAAALAAAMEGVPCEAPYDDVGTTDNLRQLSFTAFEGESGPQEMDVAGDLLLAARDMGFTTVDVSNPLEPAILGHYGDAGGMLDVKFTPDNQTALVTSTRHIDLVDVRDPAEPRQVGRWALDDAPRPPSGMYGQNAHMVFPARIAGEDWVFLAPQSSTGVWILKLQGTPDDRRLEFVTSTLPVHGGVAGPHDIFVHHDELLQAWVLYTADAFLGWTAFDVSDPANPEPIAAVPNADASGTHSIQAGMVGGRRIVATSTEAGMNALKLWDATDLARPVQVGYWTHDVGPGIYDFQHNLNIVDGRLYLAHYALGLYVFDLTTLPATTAGALSVQPIAHYARLQETTLGGGANGGFWDLVLTDGLLYTGVFAGGVQQGLHVVGFGCIQPGDPLQTSVG